MSIEDRYEVKGPMGEGGFSRVYHGEERATGRPVALKVLKSDFYDNHEVRERFQREVFAIAALSNSHIVGMYDFGLNEADVYIAMEYVAGHTLRERIRDPLSIGQRYSIIAQIADALAAAHDHNVVHRDLKPENIKIVEQEDGSLQVKVLDFGMAKLTELESRLELEPLTRAGICFGTPQYMSPEQIRGKLDDASIDLYALSIIAYELFGGRRPWDGRDPYEVMRAVLRHPAPPLERVLHYGDESALPVERLAALNAFFVRALAKEREERPASARELAADLARALYGEMGAPAQNTEAHVVSHRGDDTAPFSAGLLDAAPTRAIALMDTVGIAPVVPRVDAIGTTYRDLADEAESTLSIEPPSVFVAEAATVPNDAPGAAIDDSMSHATAPYTRSLQNRELRAEAARAAVAFSATRKPFRGVLMLLVVIAAIGGSLGYFVAGAGTAQSNELHDFVVGKK